MSYKALIALIKTHTDYLQFVTILKDDKEIKESMFEAYKILALQELSKKKIWSQSHNDARSSWGTS